VNERERQRESETDDDDDACRTKTGETRRKRRIYSVFCGQQDWSAVCGCRDGDGVESVKREVGTGEKKNKKKKKTDRVS